MPEWLQKYWVTVPNAKILIWGSDIVHQLLKFHCTASLDVCYNILYFTFFYGRGWRVINFIFGQLSELLISTNILKTAKHLTCLSVLNIGCQNNHKWIIKWTNFMSHILVNWFYTKKTTFISEVLQIHHHRMEWQSLLTS